MKYIFVFLLVILFSAPSVFAAPASLSFDPIDIKTSTGKTFEVTVNIFTGSQAVASTDIWLTYDPSILKPIVDTAKTGTLFDTIEVKEIEAGKLYIYGIQKNPRDVDPVQGTIATVQFTALKNGVTDLEFDCSSSEKSSQIITSSLSNVISCPATIAHTGTVTVSDSNVLGISTENNLMTQLSYMLGAVVVLFSVILFIRYQRIHHEIS